MFAKLAEDGSLEAYPIFEPAIRAAFPNVSFPVQFQPPEGYAWVLPSEAPAHGELEVLVEELPELVESQWRQIWSVRPMTLAELEAWRVRAMCSRFQGRAALLLRGKLGAADTAVSTCPDAMVRLAWAEATEWRRMSPGLLAIAGVLELDDAALDELFAVARQIEV